VTNPYQGADEVMWSLQARTPQGLHRLAKYRSGLNLKPWG